jgi:carboxyl-terminal processing protease
MFRLFPLPALIVLVACLCLAAEPKPTIEERDPSKLVALLEDKDKARVAAAQRALWGLGEPALQALIERKKQDIPQPLKDNIQLALDGIEYGRAVGRDFAWRPAQALEALHNNFIVPVKRGELARLAALGLTEGKEPVPTSVAKRLCRGEDLSKLEMLWFLADAYYFHYWVPHLSQGGGIEDTRQEDIDRVMTWVLKQIDPHGEWITDDRIVCDTTDSEGIGVVLQADLSGEAVLVKTPVWASPAYRAGIRAGDRITSIVARTDTKGNPLPEPDVFLTQGKTLEEVVHKILGPPGSKIELSLRRDGRKEPWKVTVARDRVRSETVLGWQRKADDSWSWWLDQEKKIGYLRIKEFGGSQTRRELDAALELLCKAGMKALVLDLRFNPGWLLQTAVEVTDRFIDDGLIVRLRSRNGDTDYKGEKPGSLLDFPMVCLINGENAGSCELAAAALQDHKRALLVGERTSGKGSVWTLHQVGERPMRITSMIFLRPSGKPWDRIRLPDSQPDDWGIRPDKGCEVILPGKERTELQENLERRTFLFPAEMPPGKRVPCFVDRQLDRALECLRAQVRP